MYSLTRGNFGALLRNCWYLSGWQRVRCPVNILINTLGFWTKLCVVSTALHIIGQAKDDPFQMTWLFGILYLEQMISLSLSQMLFQSLCYALRCKVYSQSNYITKNNQLSLPLLLQIFTIFLIHLRQETV